MKGRYLFSVSVACCIVGLVLAVLVAGYRNEVIADVDYQDQEQQTPQDQAPEQPQQPPEESPELQEDQESHKHTLRRKTLEMEGMMPKRVDPSASEESTPEVPAPEGTEGEAGPKVETKFNFN